MLVVRKRLQSTCNGEEGAVTTTTAPTTAAPVATAAAASLADGLLRLTRVLQALKARHVADGPDTAALALLPPLWHHGPLRSSALAEVVHADPSTVSRHVAELLRRGLVRREADPVDGRASLLAVTDAGRDTVHVMRERRDQWLAGVLADWGGDDVAALTALLTRFTQELEQSLPTSAQRAAAGQPAQPAPQAPPPAVPRTAPASATAPATAPTGPEGPRS